MRKSPLQLDVSDCEKPTGISQDRTKLSPLKPTESHKSPQKNWPQGGVFPQVPRRQDDNPHRNQKALRLILSCSDERRTCPLNVC